jgi:putative N-acetylmannosamine-6-phosphate epimerase
MMEEVVAPVLHNNVPDAVVDKVDVPLQLLTTFTVGVAGVVFGAAVPEPASLVQPSTVCVTVYVPALLTIMEEVVAPVLHNNVPVAVVDKVDVPLQLLTTFTIGVAGAVFGAAVPDPASLVQPLTVCVTVYAPALLTIMEAVDAPVLHNNVPVAVVDNEDVPLQLLTTFTVGVDGVVFGDAVPEPASLVQPLTDWVTV